MCAQPSLKCIQDMQTCNLRYRYKNKYHVNILTPGCLHIVYKDTFFTFIFSIPFYIFSSFFSFFYFLFTDHLSEKLRIDIEHKNQSHSLQYCCFTFPVNVKCLSLCPGQMAPIQLLCQQVNCVSLRVAPTDIYHTCQSGAH